MRRVICALLFVGCLFLAPSVQAACVLGDATKLTSILTWQNPDATDRVGVLRATVSGGPYASIATVPANTATYTDSTVTIGKAFYYVVLYVDVNGAPLSASSNEACKSFQAPPSNLVVQ